MRLICLVLSRQCASLIEIFAIPSDLEKRFCLKSAPEQPRNSPGLICDFTGLPEQTPTPRIHNAGSWGFLKGRPNITDIPRPTRVRHVSRTSDTAERQDSLRLKKI